MEPYHLLDGATQAMQDGTMAMRERRIGDMDPRTRWPRCMQLLVAYRLMSLVVAVVQLSLWNRTI
jgi:hypothetical protein